MDRIKRTADYYQLLIDKFAKTGQSPNQLRVYKEIKELVLSCSSYEEIQQKMKSGGYYESPGVITSYSIHYTKLYDCAAFFRAIILSMYKA